MGMHAIVWIKVVRIKQNVRILQVSDYSGSTVLRFIPLSYQKVFKASLLDLDVEKRMVFYLM